MVARFDTQRAVHLPVSMLGVGSGTARDVEAEVFELVRDLGLPTGQTVVESNRQFRPVRRVLVLRHVVLSELMKVEQHMTACVDWKRSGLT